MVSHHLRINILGAGKVGKTLARLWVEKKAATIKGVFNRTLVRSLEAIEFIGEGVAVEALSALPPADVYFITSSDDQIQLLAFQLMAMSLPPHAILVHCGGAFSSDILRVDAHQSYGMASIHPVKSFADPLSSVQSFAGTYCAYEGDATALAVLLPLFESIGAILFPLEKKQKLLYHAASVFSNNYLVTLHYWAVQCYEKAGVPETIAGTLTTRLMQDALNHLKSSTHVKSLTGPLQRGDIETIKQHLAALESEEALKALYLLLGKMTLPLVESSTDIFEEMTP